MNEVTITGKMKRYLFPKDTKNIHEGDFCGVVFEKEDKTTFIAKGPGPYIKEGEYSLTGTWQKDSKGSFFKIKEKKETIVDYPAIVRALMERITGVGPVTAKRIAEDLGKDTLSILEEDPYLLTNYLSKDKAIIAVASYIDSRSLKDIVSLLSPLGVGTKVSTLIYKEFKDNAVEIIEKQPYLLTPYIGFEKADNAGKRAGISQDDPSRIAALIWNEIRKWESLGHTCIPLNTLSEKTKVSQDVFKAGLVFAMKNKMVVNYRLPDQIYLYRTETEQKERRLITNLVQIAKQVITEGIVKNVPSEIAWFEKENSFKLAAEQANAVSVALQNPFAVITGGPGTGKTTIINCIRSIFKKVFPESKILLCAPTGKAARRMTESTGNEACTLHKALNIKASDEETGMMKVSSKMLNYDLIIIDETSMIDLEVMDVFLSALEKGTRVIMIGDVDQLPSVGAGAVLSDLISSGVVPVAKLITVYRQAGDSVIALNAKFIRHGKTFLDYDDTFSFVPRLNYEDSAKEMIRLFREEVQNVGIDNVVMLTPRRTADTPTGSDALNMAVHDIVNPPSANKPEIKVYHKVYRVGDKVMNLRNGEVANGEVGYIVRIEIGMDKPVSIDFDGRVCQFSLEDMKHITWGYAMTIHKSQGSEYRTVIMTLQNEHGIMLKRNLFYTGVTRAKQKCIIVGNMDAVNNAILSSENDKDKRCTLLDYRLKRAMKNIG